MWSVPPERWEDELLVLDREDGSPALIVCAIPYLRDRYICVAAAGEDIEDKERKLIEGIRNHYAEIAKLAECKRRELGGEIPIVAMGHLFAAGGATVEGDGVRERYVGSLAYISAGIFPTCFDYLVLGHLHVPQKVKGCETMRYSGSPLPMRFGEARQQKSVCLVRFDGTQASVRLLDVPVFQRVERIRGTWEQISTRMRELSASQSRTWLEVIYEGKEAYAPT